MSKHSVSLEFNTLTDMISAKFLTPGMIVKTHGRVTIDDGMESTYVILDKSSVSKYDNVTTIPLSNGHYATYYDTTNSNFLNKLAVNGDVIPASDFDIELISSPTPHIRILKYKGNSKTLSFPAYINSIPITIIGNGTTSIINGNRQGDKIKKIITPNTITDISAKAFQGMTNLTHVELSESIQNIERGAFSKCPNIEYMKIPFTGKSRECVFNTSVFNTDYLFGHIFGNYKDDNELPLNNGVPTEDVQGQQCFYRGFNYTLSNKIKGNLLYADTKIDISNKNLNNYAAALAILKKGINMSFSYDSIISVSMSQWKSLQSNLTTNYGNIDITFEFHDNSWRLLYYPTIKSNKYINDYKISTLSEWGISSVGDTWNEGDFITIHIDANDVLFDTTSFPGDKPTGKYIKPEYKYVIPKSLKTIELCDNAVVHPSAFNRIYSINTLIINDDLTKIGPLAFFYSGLKNVLIRDKVRHIDPLSFAYAYNLKSITIPKSIDTIGMFAFCGTGLREIEIPPSVSKIEQGAFACIHTIDVGGIYSPPLQSLTLYGFPIIEPGAFAFNHKLREVTCCGCENLPSAKEPEEFNKIYGGITSPCIMDVTPFFCCGYFITDKIILMAENKYDIIMSGVLDNNSIPTSECALSKPSGRLGIRTLIKDDSPAENKIFRKEYKQPLSYDIKDYLYKVNE